MNVANCFWRDEGILLRAICWWPKWTEDLLRKYLILEWAEKHKAEITNQQQYIFRTDGKQGRGKEREVRQQRAAKGEKEREREEWQVPLCSVYRSAPETLKYGTSNPKSDLFSFGVVMWEVRIYLYCNVTFTRTTSMSCTLRRFVSLNRWLTSLFPKDIFFGSAPLFLVDWQCVSDQGCHCGRKAQTATRVPP